MMSKFLRPKKKNKKPNKSSLKKTKKCTNITFLFIKKIKCLKISVQLFKV